MLTFRKDLSSHHFHMNVGCHLAHDLANLSKSACHKRIQKLEDFAAQSYYKFVPLYPPV